MLKAPNCSEQISQSWKLSRVVPKSNGKLFSSLSVHVLCLSHPAHMALSSKILPDVDRSNKRLYYVRDTIIFWQQGIKKIRYENIFVNMQRYYKRHLAPRSPHSPTTSLIRQNEKTNTVQRPPRKPDKHLYHADILGFHLLEKQIIKLSQKRIHVICL